MPSDSDAAFQARHRQLLAYVAHHGDAHVGFRSSDDPGLARWCAAQRAGHAEGTLATHRCFCVSSQDHKIGRTVCRPGRRTRMQNFARSCKALLGYEFMQTDLSVHIFAVPKILNELCYVVQNYSTGGCRFHVRLSGSRVGAVVQSAGCLPEGGRALQCVAPGQRRCLPAHQLVQLPAQSCEIVSLAYELVEFALLISQLLPERTWEPSAAELMQLQSSSGATHSSVLTIARSVQQRACSAGHMSPHVVSPLYSGEWCCNVCAGVLCNGLRTGHTYSARTSVSNWT